MKLTEIDTSLLASVTGGETFDRETCREGWILTLPILGGLAGRLFCHGPVREPDQSTPAS